MTNIKKILISDKYVISELKKLNEAFSEVTEETKEKYENFISEFEINLENILRRKFKIIDHIEFETELREFDVMGQNRYYYLIRINMFINVDQLPNYDELHTFIQIYHKEKKWSDAFSSMEYFYSEDESKQIGLDLTKKIENLINISVEYFANIKSIDVNNFGFTFRFYY